MTRRRWIADEYHLESKTAALTGDNARHLSRVLRARVGQQFELACGEKVFFALVTSVTEDRVEFELENELSASRVTGTARPVTVLLAIFKFDRMEWAIEKMTELGVAEIVPVIVQRTDAHLASAAVKRAERWRRIAHEASQQSRRVSPPIIAEPVKLKAALSAVSAAKNTILLWEGEQQAALVDCLEDPAPVVFAIGPEGGWTDDEVSLFRDAGWRIASLGSTILRAETAAVAAAAIAAAFQTK